MKYNEWILVLEEKMECCANPESPLIDIVLSVTKHYNCPWKAAEDVTVRIAHLLLDAGWTIEEPSKTEVKYPVLTKDKKYQHGAKILVRMSNNISNRDLVIILKKFKIKKGVWYSAIVHNTLPRGIVFDIYSLDMTCCFEKKCAYLEGGNWIIKKEV